MYQKKFCNFQIANIISIKWTRLIEDIGTVYEPSRIFITIDRCVIYVKYYSTLNVITSNFQCNYVELTIKLINLLQVLTNIIKLKQHRMYLAIQAPQSYTIFKNFALPRVQKNAENLQSETKFKN